ncbi:hypothetical protein AVO42_00155 [Thiomicrospira sp. XS5]|uniref:ComF family protein n=1 Tax=Thiomicrospira sp. XS5 TaxID=1775636 RepID=UPI000746D053|nr:ComF family protein [Thiomicrospira sp. XS5]KUJ73873.1 hypothetical protein AVO42_00155 [Thiomicrospira sp. XS5]
MKSFEKWLFPPTCVVSDASGQDLDLSEAVIAKMARPGVACPVCGEPLPALSAPQVCGACLAQAPSFAQTQAGFRYETVVADLIQGLKYHEQLYQARLLAELWAPHLEVGGVEALIPVPLHVNRLLERGFNQAYELAKSLSKGTGLPVLSQSVMRTKQTPPQALLNAKDRRRNLKSAFALTSETDLHGLSEVALVDDVMTTGATMEALVSVLKKRFPELRIQVWVLARASGQ